MGKIDLKMASKISKSNKVRRVSQGQAQYGGLIWVQLTRENEVLPQLPSTLVRGAISNWAKMVLFGPKMKVFQLYLLKYSIYKTSNNSK